jgi:hypothetical protein
MVLLALACGALVVLAVGFIGAPLFRSEDELEPLYRPRPGVRQLYGPTDEETDIQYGPLPEDGYVRCQHCGAVSEDSYQYCESCVKQLPH